MVFLFPQSWVLLFLCLLAIVGILLGYRLVTGQGGSKTIADTLIKWLFNGYAVLLQEGMTKLHIINILLLQSKIM